MLLNYLFLAKLSLRDSKKNIKVNDIRIKSNNRKPIFPRIFKNNQIGSILKTYMNNLF